MTGYHVFQTYDGTSSTLATTTYSDNTSATGGWAYWQGNNFFCATSYIPTVEPTVRETETEKQARLERQQQYEEKQKRIQAEEEQTRTRALELLKSHIGLEAFGKLHEVGYIELDSQKHKGRKYRVPATRGFARNYIDVYEGDKLIDRLCVHPQERYVDEDEVLTRVTLLKYAEEYLLKTANHNPVRV